MVSNVSIKDQIKKLVELQKIDGEIYSLKKELEEKPILIDGLKTEFEQSKIKLKGIEDKLKSTIVKRQQIELDLKSKEEAITKSNAQLSQIKTNREYTAKMTEIESLKADKSILEEKILLSYDESDAVTKEVSVEKKEVAEKEKLFLDKKKQVEDETKLLQDRIKTLVSQRQHIIPEIEKNTLARYEKVLEHKEGLAIVPVKDNTCGGCFMNITHQTVNMIKMHDSFIECEICLRILYIEDDL